MNKLASEKSPYLLQHVNNPVDWYPWGDEAFEKAKRENKPIFLSIGYSACHWCHVFAHESFEDNEIARLLNERFVSIKVDREERPDIDSVYMKVCQMMTGHGGWPLSIFMTPESIPFYAGTYFPKESKYGLPGFKEVIKQLYNKYTEDPEHIEKVALSVTQALQKTNTQKSNERLTTQVVDRTFHQLKQMFDSEYGGFGEAPKFPAPHNLLFLLRYYKTREAQEALEMVEITLRAMANGGMYDHIGFGFSRYSTDEKWLVPHFEKMLYDNALLLMVYVETYQITANPFYKQISEQIIEFVMREMVSDKGGFFSAIDADSEGIEGKYYVWERGEVIDVLGNDLGELFCDVYDITTFGNFEGNNIPNLIDTDIEALKIDYELTEHQLKEKLEIAKQLLRKARTERVYPHVDDKILTAWNALMITGLAKAGKVYENHRYVDVAASSLAFLEKNLISNDRVMARYRDGETKHKGYIDDYAFLLWAYVEMYDATFDLNYLQKAKDIADNMINLFWDTENGGFFFYGSDREALIVRGKEIFDGAIPSGNSVATVMLTRLGHLTGETRYLDRVEEMYHSFKEDLEEYGNASTFFLQSILHTEFGMKEVVIIGEEVKKLLQEVHERFLPNVSLLVGNTPEELGKLAPFTSEYRMIDDKVTIYVCEKFTCRQPITNVDQALQMIVE